jgi:hypothetical protein
MDNSTQKNSEEECTTYNEVETLEKLAQKGNLEAIKCFKSCRLKKP